MDPNESTMQTTSSSGIPDLSPLMGSSSNDSPIPPISQISPSTASPKKSGSKKLFLMILFLLIVLPVIGYFATQRAQLGDNRNKAAVNGSYGMACSGNTCTITTQNTTTCATMQGFSFYCPSGLDINGKCLQNQQSLGSFTVNQTINLLNFTRSNCSGAVQIDFNAGSVSADSGNCAAITLNLPMTGQTCGPTPSGSTCGSCSDWCTDIPSHQCAANGGTVVPKCSGTCAANNEACFPAGGCNGGGGGGGGTPPPKAQCGQGCSVDSDCATPMNGGTAVCRNFVCENAACPAGQTIPGANCDCGANVRKCGETCSASLGLCGDGISSCAYVVGNVCTAATGTTYCTGTQNGYTKNNCVARDQGNSFLIGPGGQTTGFTQAQITASCQKCGDGVVTAPEQCDAGSLNGTAQSNCSSTCTIVLPTPTPIPTNTPLPTATPIIGQCLNVKIYRNGTLVANPSSLQPGQAIVIAVLGTNGTKARLSINGGAFVETSTTNTSGEFTLPYTIPTTGTTSLSIQGQLFIGGVWQ